jgi:hypothetical protein
MLHPYAFIPIQSFSDEDVSFDGLPMLLYIMKRGRWVKVLCDRLNSNPIRIPDISNRPGRSGTKYSACHETIRTTRILDRPSGELIKIASEWS